MKTKLLPLFIFLASWPVLAGCTHKIVGDREKPITIEAHVTIDIRGLQETASGIEDMIASKSQSKALPEGGEKK